jgi:Asp/Glu/hydantoin racemase
MLIFGREPAQILGLVSAVIALLSSTLLDLSIDQQGVLNAVVAAVLGLVTALAVAHEKAAAAISGLMQASLACALAFGFVVSPETQGAVMAFVAAATAFWLRTQVSAPVDMAGNKVQPLPRASDEAVA